MNNSVLEYKGYYANIRFDSESKSLIGKIEGINDLVTFESNSPKKIEKEFISAVDDYLAFCKEVGKEPEKTYKGRFNVRISPELHRQIARKACEENGTINSVVEKAIRAYVMN
ncbi:MAG: type II toxin-antitoxin system HicB family antitoxin [Butyrivibrio sp.]|nr:type II toxin-antitoxin system HicB family antitoxin [Butyrivibrio sp.]